MCGGCPGGAQLSARTRAVLGHLPGDIAARSVVALTRSRVQVGAIGNGWSVRLPTGSMLVAAGVEELAAAVRPYLDLGELQAATRRLRAAPRAGMSELLDALNEAVLGSRPD